MIIASLTCYGLAIAVMAESLLLRKNPDLEREAFSLLITGVLFVVGTIFLLADVYIGAG